MILTRQKKLATVLAAVFLCLSADPAVRAQTPPAKTAIKEEISGWHAKGARVQVTLTSGRKLRGQIARVDNEAFVLQPKSGPAETVPYVMVKQVSKQGGISKAILIPAIIGGATLLVLCAGPYPIGFLCRSDPS